MEYVLIHVIAFSVGQVFGRASHGQSYWINVDYSLGALVGAVIGAVIGARTGGVL